MTSSISLTGESGLGGLCPFPLLEPSPHFRDVKDPCPVFDGERWHLFGSGGSVLTETWLVYHATASSLEGPWTEQQPIDTGLPGSGIAAPGVLFDEGRFVMFIQTEFMRPGGTIEFLDSPDGFTWSYLHTALHCLPNTLERGIYDPHPALIGGRRYLVYSGMAQGWPPRPDIYLAKSMGSGWDGPWLRMGRILHHAEIASHHNQHDHPDYEWGVEGAQVLELPDGRVLLNATSFLPVGKRGFRQRVFFAIADDVVGPYSTLGPVIDPPSPGENGHSTVVLKDGCLALCYQARMANTEHLWRYGIATFELEEIVGRVARPSAPAIFSRRGAARNELTPERASP